MYRSRLVDRVEADNSRNPDYAPRLLPYSGIILTVSCFAIYLLKAYIILPLVVRNYNTRYTALEESKQRNLINQYMASIIKIILILFSAYPVCAVVSGHRGLESRIPSSNVQMDDVLICSFQIFTGMYIFDLFFRKRVPWIGVVHHLATIVIGQAAMVLFLDTRHGKDARCVFVICLLWGTLNVLADFPTQIAMISYRTWPTNHKRLHLILLYSFVAKMLGMIAGTVTIMTIFAQFWDFWTVVFKVLVPVLQVLFAVAQGEGVWTFWCMARKEGRLAGVREGLEEEKDGETGDNVEISREGGRVV